MLGEVKQRGRRQMVSPSSLSISLFLSLLIFVFPVFGYLGELGWIVQREHGGFDRGHVCYLFLVILFCFYTIVLFCCLIYF